MGKALGVFEPILLVFPLPVVHLRLMHAPLLPVCLKDSAGSPRVRTGWLTAALLPSSCASVPAPPSQHWLPPVPGPEHTCMAQRHLCEGDSSLPLLFSLFRTVLYLGPFSLVYYFSLNSHVHFSQLLTSAVVFFPSFDLSSFSSNSCPFILRLSSFHALSL